MKTKLLMTVATAALIGTAGLVSAQSPSNAPNTPAASQTAPSAGAPAEKAAPSGEMKGGQAQMPREGGNAQRSQDGTRDGMKSKGAETAPDTKSGKAASETNMDRSKDGMKADQKNASEGKAGATTGQAGAGAKLSTEQRTTIRTSITKQNIKPATNINFSISVGTRVPRTVGFHPLPAEVITIYPDWRGYEFFLVGGEIVVVNPRTLEIVAVLEA
ncbi:MAG: DUF1236 domain-containing protein [Bosea sp. (in: a-proteobacteria)]